MYSKLENQQLKQEFWIAFAEKFPRKWVLYDTKIKDFSFKFFVDNKKAQVLIAIENRDSETRYKYYDKLLALKSIIENDFISGIVFEKNFTLENGKTICKIWKQIDSVSVSNKSYWNEIFDFFNSEMSSLENFYKEYDDFIKD
jgi:Domain of unknown function (DUF4268)